MRDELHFHIEAYADDLVRSGVPHQEARRRAKLEFGAAERVKEECREARGVHFIETLFRDIRYGLRALRKSPGFTAIAVLTLGVGIGANSAIFSVINGVLLKPLPYLHPEELIDLQLTAPGVNFPDADPAPFLYFTYREQGRSFQSVGLYRWNTQSVTGLDEPEEVQCLNVTAEVLPILGVQPTLGRWFSENDAAPGSPQTAVLTYGWWQTHFGADRSVIGRQIIYNGISRQIIGVMPANFSFLDRDAAFILPLQFDRSKEFLGGFDYPGIARLKPGVTIEQASADIARMIPMALHSFPPQPGLTVKEFEDVRLAPKSRYLSQMLIGDVGKTLWVLMGTIGIVLLIACANVANLLLVRAEGRQHELAIRVALGASWFDIARALLIESVALGLLAGALGLAFAYGAVRVLVSIAPSHLPRLHEISIDPAVILFTLGAALLTGILFGIIPVIKYAGPRIQHQLRGGGRAASQSREQHRTRSVLVVAQVALALVLLIGAGLMIRTFQALRKVDPGFDPRDVLTLRIAIPESQAKDATAVIRLEQGIVEKIRAIPGVESAGLTTVIPTERAGHDLIYARDKSYERGVPPLRLFKSVSPGLLAAVGNRLIAGREFTWTDTYERRPVAMVSENLARELWQDPQRALGKQIREDLQGPWREVIGVVNDVRDDGVQEKAPTAAYFPLLMNDFEGDAVAVKRSVSYIVRSKRAGSQTLLADVRQAVWSMNPNLPLANVRTLQEIYDKSLARTSFTLVMLAIAGAMALLIGLVGIYGVISYAVSQRQREIGTRIAVGAQRSDVMKLVLNEGMTLILIGLGVGVAGSLASTRFLSSLLFGVTATDPVTFAAVILLLALVALAACYLPARQAVRVDPMVALRYE
ncbi:MAG: putative transport system permease protein [Acidobacteriaceae bacterium]|nr:putative transport system permease protein [Acidobacteriaceae bacterium]